LKNNKMLSKGMTLVEVIVAVIVFSIMASAILTAISHANSLSNRSRMRDTELAVQGNIISKKDGNQLTDITPAEETQGTRDGYDIVFDDGKYDKDGKPKKAQSVHVYMTDEGEFSEDFGFQTKTLQKPILDGLWVDVTKLADTEYAFLFQNKYFQEVTVKVTLTAGQIFEGSRDDRGYKHTSNVYVRTIAPGKSMNFGYYNPSYNNSNQFKLEVITASKAVSDAIEIMPGLIDSEDRVVKLTFDSTGGTDPTLKTTVTYKDEGV